MLFAVLVSGRAEAQAVSQRGFVEGLVALFPQDAPNDSTRAVADFLGREELSVKPLSWLQLALGADLRANTHDRGEDEWRVDVSDRTIRRPRLSLRRATASIAYGRFSLDIGKQFIRWGKTDILNPTDRFAPRDFLSVVDPEFLPVTGLRGSARATDQDTFEVVWLPRLTPSRIPLLDQRWAAAPVDQPQLPLIDAGSALPDGSQAGVRWSHVGGRAEYSLSFFNGFNHLPNIDAFVNPAGAINAVRIYPAIRSYGADLAMPARWVTVKGEVAYFTSSGAVTDEYVLYVIQIERQAGEWVLVGGYAGEAVTDRRGALTFAPDRGLTKSAVGRAAYTIDSNRSLAFEAAVRQNLNGAYGKVEYSQAYGQHWRTTAAGIVIGGEPDDFLGQYRRNSYLSLALRYSF